MTVAISARPDRVTRRSKSGKPDGLGLLRILFFLAIAVTPLYIGGHSPLMWGLHALIFGGLAVGLEITLIVGDNPHPMSIRHIWYAAIPLALVMAWIAVQTLPVLPNPVWGLASAELGTALTGSIAVNRDLALEALLRLGTACAVFWLAVNLCRRKEAARMLVQVIAFAGGLYAFYGLVQFFFVPERLLFGPKRAYLESLTSVFVNRNSYALYAAMGAICCIAILVARFHGALDQRQLRLRILAVLEVTFGWGGFWAGVLLVTLLALVLTGSRAGVFCGFAGIVSIPLLFAARSQYRAIAFLSAALLIALAVGLLIFFGQTLSDRLISAQTDAEARWSVYRIVARMIGDSVWTGSGMSSFPDAFPPYRDATVSPLRIWDLAHNTYLELAQGLGLPAFLVLMAGLLGVCASCIMGAVRRRRSFTACLAAVAAGVALGLHSLVDFSLQMQAIALTWTALLGAGVAQAQSSRLDLSDG